MVRLDDHSAVSGDRLSLFLLHRPGQAHGTARPADAGHAAVLDLVSHPHLCLEEPARRQRPGQPVPDVGRHHPHPAAHDVHRVFVHGGHGVWLHPLHDSAALRHAGENGSPAGRGGGGSGLHAAEDLLAGHRAAVQVGHHRRQPAGVHSGGGRIRHSRAARGPVHAQHRPGDVE